MQSKLKTLEKKRANINAVFQIILQRKKPKEKQIENEAKKKEIF